MDVARVFTRPHRLHAEELFPVASTDRVLAARRAARRWGWELHGVDGGVDDELSGRRDLARLLEEAEGEAGRDAEADVHVAAPARGRAAVGGDLRRLGADLEKEAALVGGLTGAEVFDLDGVGRNAVLVVVDLD